MQGPVLARPDYEKQFIMKTDASDVAMGAVLSQETDPGIMKPVAYWSGTFNKAERNYAVGDKELMAIVKGFETWRHHLEGARPLQISGASRHVFLPRTIWLTVISTPSHHCSCCVAGNSMALGARGMIRRTYASPIAELSNHEPNHTLLERTSSSSTLASSPHCAR